MLVGPHLDGRRSTIFLTHEFLNERRVTIGSHLGDGFALEPNHPATPVFDAHPIPRVGMLTSFHPPVPANQHALDMALRRGWHIWLSRAKV